MTTSRALLVASSDDFLLEEALADALAGLQEALTGAEIVEVEEGTLPEDLAVELRSPSLFAPQRVLVMRDARALVPVKAPPDAPAAAAARDASALAELVREGLPDGTALLLGVWASERPATGPLVDALGPDGVQWIGLPPPPKPWDDVALSPEQVAVLRRVLQRAAPGARFAPAAERLLLERLGFAPRALAQEAGKLAVAAEGETVDEALVRRLVLPTEHSLEVVREALLSRTHRPLAELVAAAEAGLPIRNWQGKRVEERAFPLVVAGQAASLLTQLLYLRRQAAAAGMGAELDPRRTGQPRWYPQHFKKRLADPLLARVKEDPFSPLRRPTAWKLGELFGAAARYRDHELVAALAAAGRVEAATRGPLALEAVTVWLAGLLAPPADDRAFKR